MGRFPPHALLTFLQWRSSHRPFSDKRGPRQQKSPALASHKIVLVLPLDYVETLFAAGGVFGNNVSQGSTLTITSVRGFFLSRRFLTKPCMMAASE